MNSKPFRDYMAACHAFLAKPERTYTGAQIWKALLSGTTAYYRWNDSAEDPNDFDPERYLDGDETLTFAFLRELDQ